jgi:hypothetical protein
VTPDHFNRVRKRRAEFIHPPNTLKAKTGEGGLPESVLETAQTKLEDNPIDFTPFALAYLDKLHQAIEAAKGYEKNIEESESLIALMLFPVMQLKAHGGMFRYPLITRTADRLIELLEVIDEPDIEAVEIILAFYTAMRAIVKNKMTGDGGMIGTALLDALTQACQRYLDNYVPMQSQ